MRKWFCLLLVMVILTAAIPLVGCGDGEEELTGSPYKVGALLALSGPYSNLGIPEQRTLEMMKDQINEDGGIKGHPLEIIIYDTESLSEKAAILARKLITEDQVLAILGASDSGGSAAMIPVVTELQVPNVSLAARLSIVTPVSDRYWVFKTPQTEVEAVREIYKYLQSQDIHNVAIITDVSSYGKGGRSYLNSEAATYDITVVGDQLFASGDPTMSSQLQQIKASTPAAEAVVCWATDKESAQVAEDMKGLGMTMPLFCSHGVANKAFINAGGSDVEGVIIPAGKLLAANEIPKSDPQRKVLVEYKTAYENIHGEGTVDTFGGHAYDGLTWVLMALEHMDEDLSTGDARVFIRDYIENDINDWPGTGGVYTLSPEDHLGMQPGSLLMYKIEEGDWVWLH